jgi:tRNA nucleotidyltransferase (CCA-adding enzyme)
MARLDTIVPDAFCRTLRRLDALKQHEVLLYRGHIDLLLAALLQECGRPDLMTEPSATPQRIATYSARLAQQRLERLRVSMIGAHLSLINTLITHSAFEAETLASGAGLRHFAHQVGPDTVMMLLDLRLADRLGSMPSASIDDLLGLRERLQKQLMRQVPLNIRDLMVNGRDLQRLGLSPGPRMGEILQALLHRVLDDPSHNTRDDLLAFVNLHHGEALACDL